MFGENVSVYHRQHTVIYKATVPNCYESRIAKLSLNTEAGRLSHGGCQNVTGRSH